MMINLTRSALAKLKSGPRPAGRGQSLVEMAIAAPILIFILLGLFEVGWALRGYLALANANREVTRFAVRPGYLDYSSISDLTNQDIYGPEVGYDKVRDHVYTAMSDQLRLDLDQNATLIIHHLVIDTGWPCKQEDKKNPKWDNSWCDCSQVGNPTYSKLFTGDDLIRHPGQPGMAYHRYTYPPDTTVASRINYDVEVPKLVAANNKLNCELLKRTQGAALPSANNLVIVELFHSQNQLFGFPLISNPLTDPVPMYTHTAMRISSPRSDDADLVGPLCMAFPFTLHEDTLPAQGGKFNIFGGPGGSDFGWLGWDGRQTADLDEEYLEDELLYPRLSLNGFYNARDPNDRKLSVNDWVASLDGINAAVESSSGLVSALINRTIRIPVYDTYQPGSNGQPKTPGAYRIVRFIWVRIVDVNDINLPGKEVKAVYLGDASDACQ